MKDTLLSRYFFFLRRSETNWRQNRRQTSIFSISPPSRIDICVHNESKNYKMFNSLICVKNNDNYFFCILKCRVYFLYIFTSFGFTFSHLLYSTFSHLLYFTFLHLLYSTFSHLYIFTFSHMLHFWTFVFLIFPFWVSFSVQMKFILWESTKRVILVVRPPRALCPLPLSQSNLKAYKTMINCSMVGSSLLLVGPKIKTFFATFLGQQKRQGNKKRVKY